MQQSSRLDGLTGLRAVAALWVIAFHYSLGPFTPLGTAHASKIIDSGYLGVDLFFILSGFVICHVHAARFERSGLRALPRFLYLRAARLYPVHLCSLLLLAAIIFCIPLLGFSAYDLDNYTPRDFVLNILLIQTWGFSDQLNWNFPSWSVSAECFCYISFPLIALSLPKLNGRRAFAGIFILLAGCTLSYFTVYDYTLDQPIGVLALLRALSEFIIGCLLRRYADELQIESFPLTAAASGLLVAWLISFWTPPPAGLVALPTFSAVVLAASAHGSRIAALLSHPVLVRLGAASYSLYLVQVPVEKALRPLKKFLFPDQPGVSAAIVAIYLLILAVTAFVMHKFVENPSRHALRGWIEKRRHRKDGTRSPAHGADQRLADGGSRTQCRLNPHTSDRETRLIGPKEPLTQDLYERVEVAPSSC